MKKPKKEEPSLHIMEKEVDPELPKITKNSFPKANKPHPLIASLPKHLKDPANYDKIELALINSLATTHSHSDVLAWFNCKKCQSKIFEHRELMKKLGFQSPAQYLLWKKIHTEIKNRYPLLDWSKVNAERSIEKLKSK